MSCWQNHGPPKRTDCLKGMHTWIAFSEISGRKDKCLDSFSSIWYFCSGNGAQAQTVQDRVSASPCLLAGAGSIYRVQCRMRQHFWYCELKS